MGWGGERGRERERVKAERDRRKDGEEGQRWREIERYKETGKETERSQIDKERQRPWGWVAGSLLSS